MIKDGGSKRDLDICPLATLDDKQYDQLSPKALAFIKAAGQCTEASTGCGSCIPEIKQLTEPLIGQYAKTDLATAA